MHLFHPRIISNRPISPDFLELRFAWSAEAPLPGQFFTIRIAQSSVPLLRRPFAFSSYNGENGEAAMIYQRRGPATEMLAAKQPGDPLDVIGPLGKGFATSSSEGLSILVAGGIGLGPILYLGKELLSRGRRVRFIFGCRSKALLPSGDVFAGLSPVICTDDGSEGFAGTAGDYLQTLDKKECAEAAVFACGPNAMLKACAAWSQKRGLLCQVSMEQTMACGVGACMGCVIRVNTPSRYARVCTEGPVFDAAEVAWE